LDAAETDVRYGFTATIPIASWQSSGVINTITQDNLTEWTTYSPTWTGASMSATALLWRQEGDGVRIRGRATISSVTDNTSVTVPDVCTIDIGKLGSSTESVGYTSVRDNTDSSQIFVSLRVRDSDELWVSGFPLDGTAVTSGNDNMDTNSPITFASGDQLINFDAWVPCTEFAGSQSSLVGFSQASTTQAGLLSRFDEGSWTPVLKEGTNTMTVSTASGWYQRVGDWFQATLYLNNITATANGGNLTVEGLPYGCEDRAVGFLAPQGVSMSGNETALLRIEPDTNVLDLMHTTTANHAFFTDTDLSSTTDDFFGHISCRIDNL